MAPSPGFDRLPDDVLMLIHKYCPTDLDFLASCSRLSRLLRPDAMLPLNAEYSLRFITNDASFCSEAHRTRKSLRKQVRLNLGERFREYMVNGDVCRGLDALVEIPRSQVWSNVRILDLGLARVYDISALAGLVNLEGLDLGLTLVRDISALSRLVTLQCLDLGYTQVDDVSALAGLTNLRWLYLVRTPVQSVSALAELSNLEHLDLGLTQVEDLSALAGLVNLEALDVAYTPVVRIAALAGLCNLKALSLTGSRVQDMSPLAGLEGLYIQY